MPLGCCYQIPDLWILGRCVYDVIYKPRWVVFWIQRDQLLSVSVPGLENHLAFQLRQVLARLMIGLIGTNWLSIHTKQQKQPIYENLLSFSDWILKLECAVNHSYFQTQMENKAFRFESPTWLFSLVISLYLYLQKWHLHERRKVTTTLH